MEKKREGEALVTFWSLTCGMIIHVVTLMTHSAVYF